VSTGLPSGRMHGARDEVVPLPPPFEVVLRGFDRQQVIEHVNALKTRVATIGAERDAALQRVAHVNEQVESLRREAAEATRQVSRLRREAAEAATEVERLQRSPLTVATARIQRMLQMAEDEAAELAATAERETTSLREAARTEADRLLAEARQQGERLEAESRRRREAAEAESVSRRQRAEQQSKGDIAGRQAETEAWLSEYQIRCIAALHLLMQIVGERLNNRVVKVTRQVTAARQLRSEVTDQLSQVHRLLADALGVVDQPTAAEELSSADGAEPAGHIEPAGHTVPLNGSPTPEPAGDAGGSGGPRTPRRGPRSGPAGRPRQADPPTARFGLHP
jgi:cell division septum initiation protein DivIVA